MNIGDVKKFYSFRKNTKKKKTNNKNASEQIKDENIIVKKVIKY